MLAPGEGNDRSDQELPEVQQQDWLNGIVSVLKRIRGALEKGILGHDFTNVQSSSEDDAILPATIRYALSYNESVFTKEEVLDVARDRYRGMATYFLFKMLANSAFGGDGCEKQRAFQEVLQNIVDCIYSGGSYQQMNAEVRRAIATYDKHLGDIKGTKIAQVHRIGHDTYENGFIELAQELKQRGKVPVLLAYATLLGLKPFIEVMEDGDELMIIDPNRLGPEGGFGYRIALESGGFEITHFFNYDDFLRHDLSDIVLVDDTRHTGSTINSIQGFLDTVAGNGGVEARVVVDLLPKSMR